VTGIFGLQDRPRVRLLLRRDPFRRFYSCLIFVPREKYNTQVRQRIERVIGEALDATGIESQVQIAESTLARIHIVARTLPSAGARLDGDALERRIAVAVRSWASTRPMRSSCSQRTRRHSRPLTPKTSRVTPRRSM
jgi:glutamate dehydrogenase